MLPDDIKRADSSTIWERAGAPNGGIQLGQRDIAQSGNRAPIHERDGWVIVADARIDNGTEIRRRLNDDGSALDSDAALMLAAYRAWGDAAFERLQGDFAAALWDSNAQSLIIVRDAMGVKPLFYAQTEAGFAFASDVRTVLALTDAAPRADEAMIGIYLALVSELGDDRARTFYHAVRRVLDHQRIRVGAVGGGLTLEARSYWELDPNRETHYSSDADYADAFRALLFEATAARRRGWSDTEIGAALSGGMDSSSVVCLLRAGGGGFRTFYMQPEVAAADESAYVDTVLAGGGLTHQRAPIPGVLSGGAAIYDVLDMPTFWFNLPLSLSMYRLAAAAGVRAFFDGMDGDMVISYGRRWLTELVGGGDFARFTRETRALAAAQRAPARALMSKYAFPSINERARAGQWGGVVSMLRRLSADFGGSALGLGAYWGRNYFVSERLARAGQLWRQGQPLRWARWQQANPMLNPDFVGRLNLEARLRDSEQAEPLTARAEQLGVLRSGRLPLAFEDADSIGAAHGIVPLHPLSDRRIAEFCLGLPGEQRLRDGLTRSILRRAMGDLLPDAIARRGDKTDFTPAFLHAMRAYDLPVMDAIFAEMGRAAAYVDVRAVQATYRRWRAGGRLLPGHMVALVRIARLVLWLEAKGVES